MANSEFDLTSLNFGLVHFTEDGSLVDASNSSDSGSLFQMRSPLPLGPYDEEPVKIPIGHPLVNRMSYKMRNLLSRQTEDMAKLEELSHETAEMARSLINQGCSTMQDFTRCMYGQMNEIEKILKKSRKELDSEIRCFEDYLTKIYGDFDKSIRPAMHIMKLQRSLAGFADREKDHKLSANRLSRIYLACEESEKCIKECEVHNMQIRETTAPASTDSVENLDISSQLSTALYQVEGALVSLHKASPLTFRAHKDKPSIGSFIEKTLSGLRCLNWKISKHISPAGGMRTPLQSTQSPRSYEPKTGEEMPVFSNEKSWNPVLGSVQSSASLISLLNDNKPTKATTSSQSINEM